MEPPRITLSAESSSNASSDTPKKTIKFQCGLLRETETFVGEDLEVLCRDTLLDYVCDMLNNKVNTTYLKYLCSWLLWLLFCVCS